MKLDNMNKTVMLAAAMALSVAAVSVTASPTDGDALPTGCVKVVDGQFRIGDKPYKYVGTNFWYGAILASDGRGGDRARLQRELDRLQSLGIGNLRILAGGDGRENVPSHIMPVLQTAPGVYNDTILDGLDYLMAELERRGMKAVIYLNNAWEWSGGYGTYLEWAGEGETPNPSIDGYQAYVDRVSHFVKNDSAKKLAANHVRNIVSRTNRYTGKPYSESPALMSWQIANEPRAFSRDSVTKKLFREWLSSQAALIKSIDRNHLVSTGSEGLYGCEVDYDLWEEIHRDPNIDYAILHLWPYNWNWVKPETLYNDVEKACKNADEYIGGHARRAMVFGKPLVLEEFGYPRDAMAFAPGTPTHARDAFYSHVLSTVDNSDVLQGCNFWGWGGFARPKHENWQPWDEYTGDPAQEAQGLNSVFADDASTVGIIETYAKKTNGLYMPSLPAVAALRASLKETAAKGRTLFGHHDDPVYGHTWNGDAGRSDVLEAVGAYPAMMSWDLGGIEKGDTMNLDGVSFNRIRKEVVAQNNRGGVNTFSWHLTSPDLKHDSWSLTDKDLVAKILEDSTMSAGWERQLDRLAAFFNSLIDENGNKVAVIFRPWHEHTGSWFWWGRSFCSPEQYRQLYAATRRGLEARGVDNLLYAYSPDRIYSDGDFMERYPGDEFVDIFGVDIYDFAGDSNKGEYRDNADRALSIITRLARERGKISAFTETGLEGVKSNDWYTGQLLPLLKKYQPSYVVVWRNAHDRPGHFYVPFKGHPAGKSFNKFYKDPATVFIPR